MVEIYKISITDHDRFARDQKAIEAFRRDFHIPAAGERAIAVQTTILDFIPKHSAIVLLLQIYQKKSWALFAIPLNYYNQRFVSPYIAPSLGPVERQQADIQKILAFVKQKTGWTPEIHRMEGQGKEARAMIEEGTRIVRLLEKGVMETNGLIDLVLEGIYKFIQA